ncbi:MAG TPA: helix-turn-helix domain-containing protein [Ktedonobacteraceae bacterium]|nr:helix-turn-helix domain-containing protein [Ktedonobacteraceae bacterium]
MSQSKQVGMLPAGQVPNTLQVATHGVVLPLLLTIPMVAAKLGVSRPTVYDLIYRHGLPSLKLGRSRRVAAASLERWLQEREQSA